MTLPVVFTANGPTGYNLTKSLRFRSSASAYLNRTPASAGNRKTWTWSGWVKRGALSVDSTILSAGYSTNPWFVLQYAGSDNTLAVSATAGSSASWKTAAVFRDPSAWYHVVCAIDTTQATGLDRIKLYVNGVQQSISGGTTPTQNSDLQVNNTVSHTIGGYSSEYFDGYLAEVNFIDGQALTPSSFGSTNALTGVWQPAKYTGTYGTNGFYLPFTDTTSTTTLGYDFSGNSNNWTTNNLSLTTGSTYDSMTDVPTLTSATQANYCVLNPLSNSYTGTAIIGITDGNLSFSDSTSTSKTAIGSMTASTGKWYFEMTSSSTGTYAVGLMDKISNSGSFYRNNGVYSSSFGGGGTSGYSSWTTGDVIGVAWDADAGKLWFAKNNTWQSGSPSAGTSPTNTFTVGLSLFADIYTDNSAGTKSGSFNFGQQGFAYTPPTGFVALNTYNLPTSTIVKGNTVMDATLYTGNGGTQSVVNAAPFKPDFVWLKARSNALNHNLFDSVRGVQNVLASNSTGANNYAGTGELTAFNSNGFTLVNSGTYQTNESGYTYVGWQWQAGQGTTSSNTNGSITSTVSVNASAGFSVVTYSGNSSAVQTVGHGLGVAPKFITIKQRTASGNSWITYTSMTGAGYWLALNLTQAATVNGTLFNNTAPTSSVFTVGIDSSVNNTGQDYVAYCWTPIAGYSAIGSYTGNGSTDGPFVYTGFRPKYVMYKNASAGSTDWIILDSVRDTYNVEGNMLFAELSIAEVASPPRVDFLSNGFKIRTSSQPNESGNTIIYMAFAENPFKNALAR